MEILLLLLLLMLLDVGSNVGMLGANAVADAVMSAVAAREYDTFILLCCLISLLNEWMLLVFANYDDRLIIVNRSLPVVLAVADE
jgi:hypothetical protein